MNGEALDRGRALELTREVDVAVDQLWAAGKLSMVLRLLLEDCERLLRALRSLPGAAPSEVALLEALCQTGSALGIPALERELSPAHHELLARLASGRRRSVSRLRGSRAWSKRWRFIAAFALVALAVVAAVAVFRNKVTARASDTYSSDFPAAQSVDGLTKTEWLLPDKKTGWLELTFSRPRAMGSLRLLNCSNAPWRDRATKSFTIEAFADTRLVATTTGKFPPIKEASEPLLVPLAAQGVTRIRIAVDSFYGSGGGLAEAEAR